MNVFLFLATFLCGLVFMHTIYCIELEKSGFVGDKARQLFNIIGSTMILWIVFLFVGCTIAPPRVTSSTVAIGDNGTADAGILSVAKDAKGVVIGFYVDQGYVDNYQWMVAHYGASLKPPATDMTGTVHANGQWYIDAKHAGLYAQMIGLEINGP